MVEVYIGIGSNIEPEKNFKAVYQLLEETYPSIRFSRTFQSSAVGFDGDDFYNSVAVFSIESVASNIQSKLNRTLIELKAIENQIGRTRGDKKFAARTIDIDILLFGDVICDEPIQLPRGEIIENAYVLWPLSELAPSLFHPMEKKSYLELWQAFDMRAQKLEAL